MTIVVTHLVSGLVVDGLDVAGERPRVGRGEVTVGTLLVPEAHVPRFYVQLQSLKRSGKKQWDCSRLY